MALGQIADMDVVAHAGAVRGVVVIAKDLQFGASAHGHLGHIGHQIVGDAARVFADQAALMRAHGVEVAQAGGLPAGFGRAQVAQYGLAHQLGGAVGVDGRQRGIFAQGQVLRAGSTVDRGAGAEDHARAVVAPHGLAGVDEPTQIVAVVGQRHGRGLAHGLEGGEVHHGRGFVGGEHGVQRGGVTHIRALEDRRAAAQAFQALEHLGRAVGEIVHAHHLEAGLQQGQPGVGRDIAGGTGEQDLGGHGLVWAVLRDQRRVYCT